jgi:hypothetical protein
MLASNANVSRVSAVIACLVAMLVVGPRAASGQELDCTVGINISQLSGQEYTHLTNLKTKIEEYLNDRTWTEDRFLEHERINCSLSVVFQPTNSLSDFSAKLIVNTRRPIYNTTQSTPIMKISDQNWEFSYTEGQPLTRTASQHDDNLTSVLDFYAFMMLGYDYDTFSELGGTPYFEEARDIAERAQRATSGGGWSTSGGGQRSRAELITQLLDSRFEPLRRAYFNYHFGGLDHFVSDLETARVTVLEVLRNLQELSQNTPRSYALNQFMTAKQSELMAVFQDSEQSSAAYDVLTQLDPSSNYEKLVN